MNNIEKYRQELANQLLSIDGSRFASCDKEVLSYCPFCDDKSGHLYIKIDFDETEKPFYYCQRCQASGIVDTEFLELLNCNDTDAIKIYESTHNFNIKRNGGHKKYKNKKKYNLKILPPLNNKSTIMKLNYFNERMGIKMKIEDMLKYKIIFNFYDFLRYNNIKKLTRKRNVCDRLDRDYIGFLSANNDFIVMRNLGETDDKYFRRYIIYKIFDDDKNAKNFYIMQNKIDIMSHITINLAEGIPDIIGVYEHVFEKKDENTIFCAVCGSGYYSIISHFLKSGFIDCDINIFSDNDKNIKYYKDIKYRLNNKLFGEMNIFYNRLSKDCGTTKNNIKLDMIKI